MEASSLIAFGVLWAYSGSRRVGDEGNGKARTAIENILRFFQGRKALWCFTNAFVGNDRSRGSSSSGGLDRSAAKEFCPPAEIECSTAIRLDLDQIKLMDEVKAAWREFQNIVGELRARRGSVRPS
jgi:hypothetical protein